MASTAFGFILAAEGWDGMYILNRLEKQKKREKYGKNSNNPVLHKALQNN
jgi:hypothetical protein